jgi:hypothetical protein
MYVYSYNVLSLEDAVFFFPNFYHYLTKICGIFCFSRVSPTNLAKLLEKIAQFSIFKILKKSPLGRYFFFLCLVVGVWALCKAMISFVEVQYLVQQMCFDIRATFVNYSALLYKLLPHRPPLNLHYDGQQSNGIFSKSESDFQIQTNFFFGGNCIWIKHIGKFICILL